MDFAHIPDRIPMLLTAGELRALIDAETQSAAASAISEANRLREQVAALENANRVQAEQLEAVSRQRDALLEELRALKAPPVVVPEVPKPEPAVKLPVISMTELRGVRAATITLDAGPSDAKDATARQIMKLAKDIGFNTVRFLRNSGETIDDLDAGNDPAENLCEYAKSLDLAIVFDTVENPVRRINQQYPADKALAAVYHRDYFERLHKLGGRAIYINDMDREEIAGELETLIAQIRAATKDLNLPLFGSLTAGANLEKYRKLVDYVEIQTFGSLDEFDKYVKSDADVLCLEGRSKVSNEYLAFMLKKMQDAKRDNFMVYTMWESRGNKTNWLNMSSVVAYYRAFLEDFRP